MYIRRLYVDLISEQDKCGRIEDIAAHLRGLEINDKLQIMTEVLSALIYLVPEDERNATLNEVIRMINGSVTYMIDSDAK